MRIIDVLLMCREATTTLAPAVALAVAEEFFTDIGLVVRKRAPQELRFESDDGHVIIRIMRARPTTLEIETSGWETSVMEFIDRLPR